ncbi:MAG: alpha/beta fold hydrolase [Pseudomonadales bacterium]|jgi:pimeloyl-ACP methyl ester carboxylesterase|nr:alpha/beta fold hydrolase [Pseudomonadales bacterium]
MNAPAPLLLLHGAWHQGDSWHAVAALLRERGVTVLTPDLNGSLPLHKVSLRTYVKAVLALLDALDEPAVVVGHSMAGMVLAQCSSEAPERIKEAIYLCAYLPCSGDSVFDLIARERGTGEPLAIETALRLSTDKRSCTLDPALAASLFYNDAAVADATRAVAALSVQATLPLAARVTLEASNFARVPRTYICCTHDRVIPLPQQRHMLQRQSCQQLLQLDCGHSPFLSQPERLSALLAACLGDW